MSRLKSALMGVLIVCALAGTYYSVRAGVNMIQATREAAAPVRITFSPGGRIGEFYTDYTDLRLSGKRVIVDGLCISACTLITGLIPKDRVCVTPFAKLAFHSASNGGTGEFSSEGTRLLWRVYPPEVRKLLKDNHNWDGEGETAEHPDLIYVEGDELLTLYAPCKETAKNAEKTVGQVARVGHGGRYHRGPLHEAHELPQGVREAR